jgi:hypothetical protein
MRLDLLAFGTQDQQNSRTRKEVEAFTDGHSRVFCVADMAHELVGFIRSSPLSAVRMSHSMESRRSAVSEFLNLPEGSENALAGRPSPCQRYIADAAKPFAPALPFATRSRFLFARPAGLQRASLTRLECKRPNISWRLFFSRSEKFLQAFARPRLGRA